jgi:M6 family metalloprotease-like protein
MPWRRVLLASVLSISVTSAVSAAPIRGEVRSIKQPDGTRVSVRIWGDEFYQVVESLDGYTLTFDWDTHFACYARLAPDGNRLVSTGVPVGTVDPKTLGLPRHMRINPEAARAQVKAARLDAEVRLGYGPYGPQYARQRHPMTGDVTGICLIVDFSDDVGTITPAQVSNYCNQIGYTGFGNNGSVHDYFYDVSNHLLNYTNYVPPSYYRAAHPKSYYEDPDIPWGDRARELILEALNDLDAGGFDFSQYDADNDGYIDAINLYYAGPCNTGWSIGLWPGSGGLSFSRDGVSAYKCQWTDMDTSLTIETFCHENGHMLMLWPDLYDYDEGEEGSAGVGMFCIMCSGASATNPVHPCAPLKMWAGWSTVTDLEGPSWGLSAPSTGNIAYKIQHPTAYNEYYIIENRQKSGRDIHLPDDGLAIWHVDELGSNNWQEQTPTRHYMVTLVQADGDWDLENNRNWGDDTDLWADPDYTVFSPDTTPPAYWWDGFPCDIVITGITGSAATMYFSFGDGIWVDFDYTGFELGTFLHPFDTLQEGLDFTPVGGHLIIKAGSTSVTPELTKAMTIHAYGGSVYIGQ